MVMPNKNAESLAAAGAGTAGGRRPTVVPAPAAANPELSQRPQCRTCSTQEKLRIVQEADQAVTSCKFGAVGALLRREGLYLSALTDWRRQRDAGSLGGLTPLKRGPKISKPNPLVAELAKIQ